MNEHAETGTTELLFIPEILAAAADQNLQM